MEKYYFEVIQKSYRELLLGLLTAIAHYLEGKVSWHKKEIRSGNEVLKSIEIFVDKNDRVDIWETEATLCIDNSVGLTEEKTVKLKDLSPEFLKAIYEALSGNTIVFKEK